MERIYETDKSEIESYLNHLIDNSNFFPTTNQKVFLIELYSYMNQETILHCINSIKFADAFIEKYNTIGNFQKDFGVNEDQFLLGIAIHDAGKISVPKEILEMRTKPNDEQWKILNAHAGPRGNCIKDLNNIMDILNEKSGTNFKLKDIGFSHKVTDIAIYHHPQKVPIKIGLKDVFGIAQTVDVAEALSGYRAYIPDGERPPISKVYEINMNDANKFLKFTFKGTEGKSSKKILNFANFSLDVINENQRFCSPLEEKLKKEKSEEIKNVFENLPKEKKFLFGFKKEKDESFEVQ